MLRKLISWIFALSTLAACASVPATYSSNVVLRPTPPSAPAVTIYTDAPRAPLQSELIACNAYGSNIGPLGSRRESLLYVPYIDTPAGELLRDPTEHACLSSGFGWRTLASMGGGNGSNHTGIDLASADGGFIYAAGDGWIVSADYRGGYGLTLEIDHGHGVHTLYGHLSEFDPSLAPGMFVHVGQPIARMGMTGNATGIHLHYEVVINGLKVDPLSYGSPTPPPPAVVMVGQTPMAPVAIDPQPTPDAQDAPAPEDGAQQSDDKTPQY